MTLSLARRLNGSYSGKLKVKVTKLFQTKNSIDKDSWATENKADPVIIKSPFQQEYGV